MPKPVRVSQTDRIWLQNNHKNLPYAELAKRFNCCIDTIKRILVREGLREFEGAKYQLQRKSVEKTWNRPCMSCGSTKTRPKHWFFCKSCRKGMGYED